MFIVNTLYTAVYCSLYAKHNKHYTTVNYEQLTLGHWEKQWKSCKGCLDKLALGKSDFPKGPPVGKGEEDAAELGANTYANHICTKVF